MADFSVEAAGRPETSHQAFEVLRRQGTAIIFGMTHDEDVFPFDWGMMYSKLPRIIVTNSAAAGERVDCVRTCVDLVEQGRLDLSYMITHRLPFTEVPRAYELYSQKLDNSLKVIMTV
jgi:alcohol dehydrogenase